MVFDTLRQKYIYNTPFDENEFPKVNLIQKQNVFTNPYTINASVLYFLEQDDFMSLVDEIKKDHDSLIIKNDYDFKNANKVLLEGVKCHIMAFAFLFGEQGLPCKIE